MHPRPARRYPVPRYPTRIEAAAQPGLLYQHQPASWKVAWEISALAMTLLAVSLASCSGSDSRRSDNEKYPGVDVISGRTADRVRLIGVIGYLNSPASGTEEEVGGWGCNSNSPKAAPPGD
jgi:hypothetical protein